MFYIVSLNPSVDYDMFMDLSDAGGEVNQANAVNFRAAGKGVNVAKMLGVLGEKCVLTGFVAGFTGSFIEDEMGRKGVETDFIRLGGRTRVNVKVRKTVGGRVEESELTGIGPKVTDDDVAEIVKKLSNVGRGDYVFLTGSVPGGVSDDVYRRIAEELELSKRGAITAVDTRGALLCRNVLDTFVVKPNLTELKEALKETGKAFDYSSRKGVAEAAKEIARLGVDNVIVSLGGDGAILTCAEGDFYAEAPSGDVVQTMGAGDSVLTGFAHRVKNGAGVVDAFAYGVACGSATAFSPDMGEKRLIDELYTKIKPVRI